MCTVTFIPTQTGYYLGMNRDERTERGPVSPPESVPVSGTDAVFPRDVEGGTWIAGNAKGCAFALINWNEPQPIAPKGSSRGLIIPRLVGHSSSEAVAITLACENPGGVLPFRVIGIFPDEEKILEWRWDQIKLTTATHPWSVGHWCSSGLSDERAAMFRNKVSEEWRKQEAAGTLPWLRRLHASHEHAPFGFCVHRGDVETLSYSEIVWDGRTLQFRYREGSPCSSREETVTVETDAIHSTG
jgi:hypothetical protein